MTNDTMIYLIECAFEEALGRTNDDLDLEITEPYLDLEPGCVTEHACEVTVEFNDHYCWLCGENQRFWNPSDPSQLAELVSAIKSATAEAL